MDYETVVQAFLDLFGKDISTYNEQNPYGFIIFAIRVLFHLYSDELESIGSWPTPCNTDDNVIKAIEVFAMIKELAKKYDVCLCCGKEIPTFEDCSPEDQANYEYLDGWCPTCVSELSHRYPLDNDSVTEALDVFGLKFIA